MSVSNEQILDEIRRKDSETAKALRAFEVRLRSVESFRDNLVGAGKVMVYVGGGGGLVALVLHFWPGG